MKKTYNIHFKSRITFCLSSSVSEFWNFLDKNLIWLKNSEIETSGSFDIHTQISQVKSLSSDFVNTMTQGHDRLGYDLYLKNSSVVCLHQGWLLWKYEITEDGKINLNIYYTPKKNNFLIQLIKWILKRPLPAEENRQRLLYLSRIGLHFPLFMLLGKIGIRVMHASAVEKNGKAIVFAGYDGIGKSTMALYLTEREGFRAVADNFLLYDDKYIYPLVESARLNQDSACYVGVEKKGAKIHGRHEVEALEMTEHNELVVSAFFFNLISHKSAVEKADKNILINIIKAMDDYLLEFLDYRQFLSVVSLVEPDMIQQGSDQLESFMANTKLYLLKKRDLADMNFLVSEVIKCSQIK